MKKKKKKQTGKLKRVNKMIKTYLRYETAVTTWLSTFLSIKRELDNDLLS